MEIVSFSDTGRSSSTVTLWDYLKLLMRSTSNSKDSIEGILQTLWRTRRKGLDAADRSAIVNMLQLENESDLNPILVCLRMLIRRCVYDNIDTDGIHTLFPGEVLPELQTLLTQLLQKFQNQWREDVLKEDQGALPRLKATAWNNMEKTDAKSPDPKLKNDVKFNCGESKVQSQVAKGTLEATWKSMYSMREAFL